MQDTIDQSGKKEVWKKEEMSSPSRRKRYSKHKGSKLRKILKKFKKWYKSTFKINSTPNPHKYFNKLIKRAAIKRRKQTYAALRLSFQKLFAKKEQLNTRSRKRKFSIKRKKIQKEIKKVAINPIVDLTKKKKTNIYVKFERELLLKKIKAPVTNLFKKESISSKKSKKRTFTYYFEREQRKLRSQRFKQFKLKIVTAPKRFIKGTLKGTKKVLKFIFGIRKEYRLLKIDFIRVKENVELKNRLVYTYLNSTISFLLSFIIIFFINQIVTVYVCSLYNIPTLLHSFGGFINYNSRYRQIMDYFDIIYLVGPYSYLWTRFNIIVIFGAAPFLSLLMAVLFYKLFLISKTKLKFLKLFFLWSLINSFNMFFGAYIAGAITRSGFIKFSEWIFYSNKYDISEIIMMVCSMIVLITIGYFTRTFFLKAADHKDLTIPKNRIYYLFAQVLLPYLSGILFLVLISVPYIVHFNIFIYLPIFLVVATAVVSPRGFQKENVSVSRHKRDYNILKYGTFLLFLIILIFKMFFYKGITFA